MKGVNQLGGKRFCRLHLDNGVKRRVYDEDLEPEYPWERQPNESPEAYLAFSHYRDDREFRRIRKTCAELGKPRSTVSSWSSPDRHNWLKRCAAFDKFEDEERQKAQRREIRRMHARHAKHAVSAIEAASHVIEKLRPSDKNPEPDKMKHRDAIRLLDVGVRIERLSRGEPDTIQKTEGEMRVTNVDDKRASMVKLLEDPGALRHLQEISKRLGTDGSSDE